MAVCAGTTADGKACRNKVAEGRDCGRHRPADADQQAPATPVWATASAGADPMGDGDASSEAAVADERGLYHPDRFNDQGLDDDGFDEAGFDEAGFDRYGLHRDTGTTRDPEGADASGDVPEGWKGPTLSDRLATWDAKRARRKAGELTVVRPGGFALRFGTDQKDVCSDIYALPPDVRTQWLAEQHAEEAAAAGREPWRTFDEHGLDQDGMSLDYYDADGLRDGWDRFDRHVDTGSLYGPDGHDLRGFDRKGVHRDTGSHRDPEGWDVDGTRPVGWQPGDEDRSPGLLRQGRRWWGSWLRDIFGRGTRRPNA